MWSSNYPCRPVSRTPESLSMFSMLHIDLPAHAMSRPNIMFYWKRVRTGVEHFGKMHSVLPLNYLSKNTVTVAVSYMFLKRCNYFWHFMQNPYFPSHIYPVKIHLWPAAGELGETKCITLSVGLGFAVSPVNCPEKPQSSIRLLRNSTVFGELWNQHIYCIFNLGIKTENFLVTTLHSIPFLYLKYL